MSRDWILLLTFVTVSIFTLANSIPLAIEETDDQELESVDDEQVRMRSPKKKAYQLIEEQELLKEEEEEEEEGEEPVNKNTVLIKSIKHYFRDLYRLSMKKSSNRSLENKLNLSKEAYKDSLDDVQVMHYLDTLQVAIDAKRDYEAAEKSLTEAVTENDKKVLREEVKKARKFAKKMAQQVHRAEDRLRTRLQRNYIRPMAKYGFPGGLIVGAVRGIVRPLHNYNKQRKLPQATSEKATFESFEQSNTVVTLIGFRAAQEEGEVAVNSLQEENKKKSSDISRVNFAIAIAFGVILLMATIAIGGILLIQRYGSNRINDSNSSSNDNSYDILSSGLEHSGKVN